MTNELADGGADATAGGGCGAEVMLGFNSFCRPSCLLGSVNEKHLARIYILYAAHVTCHIDYA